MRCRIYLTGAEMRITKPAPLISAQFESITPYGYGYGTWHRLSSDARVWKNYHYGVLSRPYTTN